MKRVLLLTSLLALAAEGGSSQARPPDGAEQVPPSASPAAPAPPAHDPLEEFVPHEKLEADSVVALPVDI
ncbi:MAG TPA: hypothetical protein VFQ51_18605 [Vicinamibacteria bacterium]|nr:hypothetical protein [Vicinamibacteria bacterium]